MDRKLQSEFDEQKRKRRRSFQASLRNQKSVWIFHGELNDSEPEYAQPDGHAFHRPKTKKSKPNQVELTKRDHDFKFFLEYQEEDRPGSNALMNTYRHRAAAGEPLFQPSDYGYILPKTVNSIPTQLTPEASAMRLKRLEELGIDIWVGAV